MDDLILENKIKKTLEHRAEICEQDAFEAERIRAKVYSRIKEAESMRIRNWKRTAVAAAAICVFGSMTVLGIGKTVSIMSGSSHKDEITSYQAAEAVLEGIDSDIKMVREFSNGYVFEMAVPVDETGMDKDGNVTEKGKAFHVVYGKENMADVSVFTSHISEGITKNPDAVRELEDGTKLLYTELVNKTVSDEYVPIDEEKALQEAGKLNIVYDGRKDDKVDVHITRHITWLQDGIVYSMMVRGTELSSEDFFDMAQELAESK